MNPRLLVVLGIASLVLVFILPPVAAVGGVLTIVFAVRRMNATRPQPQELLTPDGAPVTVNVAQPGRPSAVVALVLGIAAAVLGILVTVMLVVLWPEVSDYNECRDSTVTTQGEQKCRDTLEDAIKNRFGQ